MDEAQKVVALVEQSFLNRGQKDELLGILETRGADDFFFGRFNELLITEIDVKAKMHEGYVREFEALCEPVDLVYIEEKKSAEDELEKSLSETKPTDMSARKKVFDEYHQKMQKSREKYEKTFNEKSADFMHQFYVVE